MDNKENEQIENILKKSVSEIEIKPFEERWESIESRLEFDRGEKFVIKEQVPVLATQSNASDGGKPINNKSKILVLSISLFFIILLAIVIPLSLHKSEPVYFELSDLAHETVDKDTFSDAIKKSKIGIVSIADYQCEEYTLLKTETGDVQGGSFVINEKDNFAVVHVTFYSSLVIVPDTEFIDADKYTIDKTEISYKKIEDSTELIEFKALAKHNNVTYELKYLSLTDNVTEFFDRFFS